MYRIALKMLSGDRVKYSALILGVTFTAFLVTFAASYFCGFMTRGFALIADNPSADIWVMDAAVESVEQTTNMPNWAMSRVRSVEGVATAAPLLVGMVEMRFPNGRFQPIEVIGVDKATLSGAPARDANALRLPDAAIADEGGTEGKLLTRANTADAPPRIGSARSQAPTRMLAAGDMLQVNDHRVRIVGISANHPRFPARPLLYMTLDNALRILPPERRPLTFVLVSAARGVELHDLCARIESQTGLKARTTDDFKADTVAWYLANSEDVGDIASMLTLAITVGFGVTGVMLYMFTSENLRQYAVLGALGGTPKLLMAMIFVQAGACGLIGTGLGVGLCGIVGTLAQSSSYPFRMMWFTPLTGGAMVVVIGIVAAFVSARPVLRLQPAVVFAGR